MIRRLMLRSKQTRARRVYTRLLLELAHFSTLMYILPRVEQLQLPLGNGEQELVANEEERAFGLECSDF
jgi:hypothetical protein